MLDFLFGDNSMSRQKKNLSDEVSRVIEEVHDLESLSSIDQVDCYFPWKDVAASLDEDPTIHRIGQCPTCSGPIYECYFSSPAWTWKNLCGRAGNLIFCPKCAKQYSFECTVMN